MYIVTNTTKINKNEGYKLVERFNKQGKVEKMPGFLGLEVLLNEKLDDCDEVSIVTRWDNEESFKHWYNSKEFKEAHQHGKDKPSYIISNRITHHEVKVVRKPIKEHA